MTHSQPFYVYAVTRTDEPETVQQQSDLHMRHSSVFSTLEKAQWEVIGSLDLELNPDSSLKWIEYGTDMEGVKMYVLNYMRYGDKDENGPSGYATITKYPLDNHSLELAGLSPN